MKFLGIDLGWSSGASGLCCLAWQTGKLTLIDLQRLDAIADVFTWIDTHLPTDQPGMVAVDAPTLIANPTGMRLCDRLAHKHFGKYHAGCYPANLGLPFAKRTVEFGLNLEARGFLHAPTLQPQQPGRFQIESFPHPAIVHLFQLQRILKYKKGTVAQRAAELATLRTLICDRLPLLDPPLDVLSSAIPIPAIPTKGTALKAVEDQLDSIICAYIAAHWWYWGADRNLVLGNLAEGYIVVPTPNKYRDIPL
jgi:predicted RNase H-like nuclease